MDPIATAAEIQAALALDRCAIFLWVRWSVSAMQSQGVIKKALEQMADRLVPFFRLDVSDGEGETWSAIRAWLKEGGCDADNLTYSGAGALVFVLRGKPVRALVTVSAETPASLAAAITAFGQVGTDATRPLT